jgi:hypothetical protein
MRYNNSATELSTEAMYLTEWQVRIMVLKPRPECAFSFPSSAKPPSWAHRDADIFNHASGAHQRLHHAHEPRRSDHLRP